MATGHALLTGLKAVDPVPYGGWDGTNGCWGCELDVDNVRRILTPLDFRTSVLKTERATSDRILRGLHSAADTMQPNDLFVFYFSGHGGQQPDANSDELDGQDETLVAYDRQILDDELYDVWKRFRKGVRIVMISDSCNSGTNYRMLRSVRSSTPVAFDFGKGKGRKSIDAQLIHFGGCRDGFSSAGYYGGGAFTMALCEAWANGQFDGNYRDFHKRIVELTEDETQQPQHSEFGGVTASFRNQRPFQIEAREPSVGPSDTSVLDELRRLLADLNDRVAELEHKAEWATEPEKAKA